MISGRELCRTHLIRISAMQLSWISAYTAFHSLVRLFGMPDEISAVSTKLENGFDGNGIVLMKYNNMIAEAVYSKISNSVTQSILQGEDGFYPDRLCEPSAKYHTTPA